MTTAKPAAALAALLVRIAGQEYRVEWRGSIVLDFVRADDPLHLGYIVVPRTGVCTCPDFRYRGRYDRPCKHLSAARDLRLIEAFRVMAGMDDGLLIERGKWTPTH